MKKYMYGIGLGALGVLLYQNIKNGNIRNLTRKMNSAKTEFLEDVEEYLNDMD